MSAGLTAFQVAPLHLNPQATPLSPWLSRCFLTSGCRGWLWPLRRPPATHLFLDEYAKPLPGERVGPHPSQDDPDPTLLTPLLVAYDRRIKCLEEELQHQLQVGIERGAQPLQVPCVPLRVMFGDP